MKSRTDELLGDIKFVVQTNKQEIEKISERLRFYVETAGLDETVRDSLIDEVSNQLGQLSARVKLTEHALLLVSDKQAGNSDSTNPHHTDEDVQIVKFDAQQLIGNKNLLPLETSAEGLHYSWSGSDKEIQITLPIDRSKILDMQIFLFALIKPEYSRKLKIYVDNVSLKHRFSSRDGLFILSCNLPSSTSADQTKIKIVLPATHTPMELGISQDHRKLGLAISEIRFGPPQSWLTHLLTRLRFSA